MDGELHKGKPRKKIHLFFHYEIKIHLTILKSFLNLNEDKLSKKRPKLYHDYLIIDSDDEETKDNLPTLDIEFSEENLNYLDYVYSSDIFNIKYNESNNLNYFFKFRYNKFNNNILILNELKVDLNENRYLYYVRKHANNYNSLKVGWGKTYDLVNIYGHLMDHKYIIGSKKAFEFISKDVRKDNSVK